MDSHLTKVLFFPLSWEQLQTEIPDDDNYYKMAILSNRELSVVLSVVNIVTRVPWAWGIKKDDPVWIDILEFRDGIEAALMAVLNVDDLIKTNLMLVSAITGEEFDLDHPENYLTGNYAPESGLTPVTEANNPNEAIGNVITALGDITTQLEEIVTAISNQATGDPEQLADDLEGIVNTIQTVATVLGALA